MEPTEKKQAKPARTLNPQEIKQIYELLQEHWTKSEADFLERLDIWHQCRMRHYSPPFAWTALFAAVFIGLCITIFTARFSNGDLTKRIDSLGKRLGEMSTTVSDIKEYIQNKVIPAIYAQGQPEESHELDLSVSTRCWIGIYPGLGSDAVFEHIVPPGWQKHFVFSGATVVGIRTGCPGKVQYTVNGEFKTNLPTRHRVRIR